MGPALTSQTLVGVLGAGAMGSGIAQVAATAGHRVVVVDSHAQSLEKGREAIGKALARDVEKGRLAADAARAVSDRLQFMDGGDDLACFRECGLVIEAIVEDLAAKQREFARIDAAVPETCILASNTSSLSIAALAGACHHPARVIGLHFFNPAPVLPLVEVVAPITGDSAAVAAARALMETWKKVPVVTSDTPGFIVNRVARPFYGESIRILEEGIADVATIDWAMREIGGFRMGPFELMDLIGNDVNYAVTRSVFEALGFDPRYRPSVTQRRMVDANRLGRKTGIGYYDYRDGAPRPSPREDRELGTRVLDRVLAMLVNEAADAVLFKVATPRDIDVAVTKGVNYPTGLLAWGDQIGPAVVLDRLESLQREYGEDRYRPSALLKRVVRSGGRLLT